MPFTFLRSSIELNLFAFLYSIIASAFEAPIPSRLINSSFEAVFKFTAANIVEAATNNDNITFFIFCPF